MSEIILFLQLHFKFIVGVIASLLVLIGYIPYMRDTLSGKTKPSPLTWFVWAFAGVIVALLQIYHQAGPGAYPTFTIAFIALVIGCLTLYKGIQVKTTLLDYLFILLSLVSLGLWLIVDEPVWATILIVLADVLSFAPTVRKSWNDPFSETLSSYQVNAVRYAFALLALSQYNIITLLYPIAWISINIFFSFYLSYRRKVVKNY